MFKLLRRKVLWWSWNESPRPLSVPTSQMARSGGTNTVTVKIRHVYARLWPPGGRQTATGGLAPLGFSVQH